MEPHHEMLLNQCLSILAGILFAFLTGAFASVVGLPFGMIVYIFIRICLCLLTYIATGRRLDPIPPDDPLVTILVKSAIAASIIVGIVFGFRRAYRSVRCQTGSCQTSPSNGSGSEKYFRSTPMPTENPTLSRIRAFYEGIQTSILKSIAGLILGMMCAILFMGFSFLLGVSVRYVNFSVCLLLGRDLSHLSLITDTVAMTYILRIAGGIGGIGGSINGYVWCGEQLERLKQRRRVSFNFEHV